MTIPMEPEGDPSPERRIAEAIRGWVRDRDPAAREELAAYGVRHVRSFLHQRRSLRRFGFKDDFAEVATDVADMEVAELLPPVELETPPVDGTAKSPLLWRRLRSALGPSRSEGDVSGLDPVGALEEVADLDLFLAYRRVLRLRADQGLRRRWAEAHSEEARLLRRLRSACRRIPAIVQRRDLRGTFFATRESDLSRRVLRTDEIRSCLEQWRAGPRAVMEALLPLLAATGEHGGYCYQMDLVREVYEDRVRRFTAWAREEAIGARSTALGPGGVPFDLTAARIHQSLSVLAEEILRRDRQDAPAEVRAIWREVAVEMILRRYGLAIDGRDPRAGSQRRMLAERLGLDPDGAALRYHDGQTTYLVRRLGARWAG